MILEKMKSCLWKLGLGFWTHGFIRLLDPRRKISYHPLLICFFYKLISIQDVGCKCSITAAITLCSCTSELSPTNDKDAELSRQFPFGIDLNKILPNLLKLRMKAEKPDRQFLITYIRWRSTGSNLCSWLIFS